ncbi:hypothetical protein BRC82_08600 [Halobacteriales archaeon QS_1_67_19]|nr:MAG: hypothetical protein BRC82_08600 [Halobacteriales archaeon QS_1_67_19]
MGLVGAANAQESTTQVTDDEVVFVAGLSGENQTPTVESDAVGIALFVVGEDAVDYALALVNVEDLLMAHIHAGGADDADQFRARRHALGDAHRTSWDRSRGNRSMRSLT